VEGLAEASFAPQFGQTINLNSPFFLYLRKNIDSNSAIIFLLRRTSLSCFNYREPKERRE